MSLSNKPLEAINESDLQALRENGVREKKDIDYKASLPNNTHDSKKEFLADISSFANASGGHLVLGMREEAGVPVELCGLQHINVDAEVNRLDNLLRDGIKPRLYMAPIQPVSLRAQEVAIVIRIPKSWAAPHVVDYQGHWRFYSRNSSGKYPLDIGEVRTAFALTETIGERIRDFRAEQLGRIVAG